MQLRKSKKEHCNIHSSVSLGTGTGKIVSMNTKSLFSREFETVKIKCASKFNRDCLPQNIPLVMKSLGPVLFRAVSLYQLLFIWLRAIPFIRHCSFENQYNDNWCSWMIIQMFLKIMQFYIYNKTNQVWHHWCHEGFFFCVWPIPILTNNYWLIPKFVTFSYF